MNNLAFQRVPILAYHKIGWPTEVGITTVLPWAFQRQMQFLAAEGYVSLHPGELLQALQHPGTLPPRPVLITFDDGYESLHEVAYPILRRFGFTATVFIPTGYIGQANSWEVPLAWKRSRHLDWAQLDELAQAGFCIGAHGREHRFMTHTGDLRVELETPKRELEENLGVPVEYLAYPYGAWNDHTVEQTKKFGYRAAFAYEPRPTLEHPYALPRVGVFLHDTMRGFCAKLGLRGQGAFQRECFKHRFIHRFTYANLLHPRYWGVSHG